MQSLDRSMKYQRFLNARADLHRKELNKLSGQVFLVVIVGLLVLACLPSYLAWLDKEPEPKEKKPRYVVIRMRRWPTPPKVDSMLEYYESQLPKVGGIHESYSSFLNRQYKQALKGK